MWVVIIPHQKYGVAMSPHEILLMGRALTNFHFCYHYTINVMNASLWVEAQTFQKCYTHPWVYNGACSRQYNYNNSTWNVLGTYRTLPKPCPPLFQTFGLEMFVVKRKQQTVLLGVSVLASRGKTKPAVRILFVVLTRMNRNVWSSFNWSSRLEPGWLSVPF